MVLFSATFKKAAESFSAFSDNLRWLSAKDEIKPYHDRYLTPSTNQRTFFADRATWTGMLLWPEAREKRVLRVVCQGVRHFPGCLVCVGSSCGGCSAPIQPSYSLPRHRMCRSGVYDSMTVNWLPFLARLCCRGLPPQSSITAHSVFSVLRGVRTFCSRRLGRTLFRRDTGNRMPMCLPMQRRFLSARFLCLRHLRLERIGTRGNLT